MKLSSLIELKNVSKVYETGGIKFAALQDIHLKIEKSEMVAIVGKSGSGKTTLMNIIGLLDKPSSGEYFLNGKDMDKTPAHDLAHIRNRSIGFIFQSYFLLPRLTLLDNVGLPLSYRDCTDEQIREYAHLALQRVGVDHLAHRFPGEVSGGQLQRAAIARALVGHPSVILADEPTSALHVTVAQEIMDLFVQLNTLDKNTIVIITHEEKIAAQCQRNIHIQDGFILPS